VKPKMAIFGAAGRMGKCVISAVIDSGQFEIIAAIEHADHPDIGKDAGLLASASLIGVKIVDHAPAGAEVAIDFSSPHAADRTVDYCLENNSALVMGTTGLSSEQQDKIRSLSRKTPVLYATNMSVGMNVLFALAAKAAAMLGDDYDVEIVEQHHRFKKDAPSGSALTLGKNICEATGRDFAKCIIYGRYGKDTQRKKGDIGIHAVRAGDITGVHSVIFSTLGETVTLNHSAHSRAGFAKGAVRAAQWLIGKGPGLYSMGDVLGIK